MFIWMFVRVYECVCVHMFVVLFVFYFVLFKKKKKWSSDEFGNNR